MIEKIDRVDFLIKFFLTFKYNKLKINYTSNKLKQEIMKNKKLKKFLNTDKTFL